MTRRGAGRSAAAFLVRLLAEVMQGMEVEHDTNSLIVSVLIVTKRKAPVPGSLFSG